MDVMEKKTTRVHVLMLLQTQLKYSRISSVHANIKPRYDVVVIGSGYGGAIAASRSARAGQSVCVLERGKEWLPGEFPESFHDASDEVQVSFGGKKSRIGELSSDLL